MKMKNRIGSLFLVFCLLVGLFMQKSYVLAMDTEKVQQENALVNYEVVQQYDNTTNKVDILLNIKESEEIEISKVKLPDGTECTENLSSISYTVDKNGIYDFTLYYDTADTSAEKAIQEEVTQIVSDTQDVEETINDEAKNEEVSMSQADNIYTVNDYEGFENAVNDINNNGNDTDEYVISLNNDITLADKNNGVGLSILKKIVILGNGHTLWVNFPGNQLIPQGNGSLSLGKQGEIEKSKLTISQTKGNQRDRALLRVGSPFNHNGVLNIYDGVTIKNADCNGSSMGSAIAVYGTLNMYGGEITENSIGSLALIAGAVGVEEGGTFNMYGGKIHNNTSGVGYSVAYGGGVLINSGTFNMYGGEISNNKSVDDNKTLCGGGVALINTNNIPPKATFGKDAVVKENIGTQGGGLYIQADAQVIMDAGFKLFNNQAKWGGGLFHAGTSPLDIKQGVIVANNTASNSGADIYTAGTAKITLSDASNMNQKFNGSDSDITGWYYDYNPRWEFMDADKVDITKPVSEKTGLIAAYEGLPKYRVTYEFVTGTNGKELPDEVTALLPTDTNEYEHGTTVTAIQPDETTIKVADGTWTFKGYDADEKVATSDLMFTGTWEFTINKYPATYEFVTGTNGKELPDELTALLPTDTNEYEHGATVTAIQPNETTIKVADGTWTFKGYDADEKVATSNVKFIGVWIFNPKASIINAIPVINAEDKTLTVGDNFDPLSGVSATDKEDGDITLTKDNIIANDVDTSKAGIYHVTYKVTDKNGASAEKTITVTVNEKTTTPEEKPNNKPSKPNQKPSKTDIPKTGDATNLGLFASLLGGSGSMLLGLNRKKRKRNKND